MYVCLSARTHQRIETKAPRTNRKKYELPQCVILLLLFFNMWMKMVFASRSMLIVFNVCACHVHWRKELDKYTGTKREFKLNAQKNEKEIITTTSLQYVLEETTMCSEKMKPNEIYKHKNATIECEREK